MGYEIMTENSSPPRLEKLPSPRSPTSRKDNRRQSKLRFIHVDPEKTEKENDAVPYNSLDVKSNDSILSITPKIKLSTVLDDLPIEDSKLVEGKTTNNQVESDMIVNCSVSSSANVGSKSQNDSIKLGTLNLSKTTEEKNQQSLLEDTVDIANLTSFTSMSNLSGSKSSGSQPISEGDTLPVTDSVFSNPLSQDTQSK